MESAGPACIAASPLNPRLTRYQPELASPSELSWVFTIKAWMDFAAALTVTFTLCFGPLLSEVTPNVSEIFIPSPFSKVKRIPLMLYSSYQAVNSLTYTFLFCTKSAGSRY